jgi:hypothetical protein
LTPLAVNLEKKDQKSKANREECKKLSMWYDSSIKDCATADDCAKRVKTGQINNGLCIPTGNIAKRKEPQPTMPQSAGGNPSPATVCDKNNPNMRLKTTIGRIGDGYEDADSVSRRCETHCKNNKLLPDGRTSDSGEDGDGNRTTICKCKCP